MYDTTNDVYNNYCNNLNNDKYDDNKNNYNKNYCDNDDYISYETISLIG